MAVQERTDRFSCPGPLILEKNCARREACKLGIYGMKNGLLMTFDIDLDEVEPRQAGEQFSGMHRGHHDFAVRVDARGPPIGLIYAEADFPSGVGQRNAVNGDTIAKGCHIRFKQIDNFGLRLDANYA